MTVRINKPALNVREELSKLNKPSGVAGEAMLRAETPQEQFNLIGAGRKNFIINGGSGIGVISQRGTYQNYGPVTNGKYYYDRWECYASSITMNISTSGGWIKGEATSADGAMGFTQKIEDYAVFKGKTLTVSAKVKATNPNARILLNNGSSWFASSKAHSGNGQEELLTITVELPDTATALHVSLRLATSNGSTVSIASGDYIEFTEVQLELGSVATPFEHRSYGEELALCQRYYQAYPNQMGGMYHYGPNDPNVHYLFVYPVKMRATPLASITVSNGTAGVQMVSDKSVEAFSANVGTTGEARINTLYLDAEL